MFLLSKKAFTPFILFSFFVFFGSVVKADDSVGHVGKKILTEPDSKIYDLTRDTPQKAEGVLKEPIEVDAILREVDKVTSFRMRDFDVKTCPKDFQNTEFCPIDLGECADYWDYNRGYSQGHTRTKYMSTSQCLGEGHWEPQYQIYYYNCCSNNGSPDCTPAGTGGCEVNFSYTSGPSTYPCYSYPDRNFVGNFSYLHNYDVKCPKPPIYKCPSGYYRKEISGTYYCILNDWEYSGGSQCSYTYTYYTYHCHTDTNFYGENWIGTLRDSGGDCGSKGCNSSTPPNNNCKRKNWKCVPENSRRCAKVNGKWMCSKYGCYDEKCGFAICREHPPAPNGPPLVGDMLPLRNPSGGVCNKADCDLSIYSDTTYCGEENCPSGFGIVEQNGGCYQSVCPPGAVKDHEGNCVEDQCPPGTEENAQGTCDEI